MIRQVDGRCRVELPDGSLSRGRFHTEAQAQEHHLALLAQRVVASLARVRPEDQALAQFAASFRWQAQYVRIDA